MTDEKNNLDEVAEHYRAERRKRIKILMLIQVMALLGVILVVSIVLLLFQYGDLFPIDRKFNGLPILLFTASIGMVAVSLAMAFSVIASKARAQVFVSFSYENIEEVNYLVDKLRTAGVRVLRPEETIRVGDDIGSRLKQLIDRCSHVIVVAGPKYEESHWAAIELAMLGRRVKVLPILLRRERVPRGLERVFYLSTDNIDDEVIAKLLPSLPLSSK